MKLLQTYILAFAVLFASCNRDRPYKEKNDSIENSNIEKTKDDNHRETIIKNDEFEILINSITLNKDSYYFYKTYKSVSVIKDGQETKLFKIDHSDLLDTATEIGNKQAGFRDGYNARLLKFSENDPNLFCIEIDRNQCCPGCCIQYGFFEIDKNIKSTPNLINASQNWFRTKDSIIISKDKIFMISLHNHRFHFLLPAKLHYANDTDLEFKIAYKQLDFDQEYLTVIIDEINRHPKHYNKTDSILIYPSYDSPDEELVKIPCSKLEGLSLLKAVIKVEDKENILDRITDGFIGRVEIYKSGKENWKTNWSIYIESDSIKGWVRRNQDIIKLGLNDFG